LLINRLAKRIRKAALERWPLFCLSDALSDSPVGNDCAATGNRCESLRPRLQHGLPRFAVADTVAATGMAGPDCLRINGPGLHATPHHQELLCIAGHCEPLRPTAHF